MGNNEHDVKTIGFPLTALAVPPGAARARKVSLPQKISLQTSAAPQESSVESPTASIATETATPQVKASGARPKLSLKNSKIAPAMAGVTPTIAAESASTLAEKMPVSSIDVSDAQGISETSPSDETLDIPTENVEVTQGSAESPANDLMIAETEKILPKESTDSVDTAIDKSLDTTHITHYIERHGTPAWAVLQAIGRAGVRVTLIAEDGILGDQIVPNLKLAQDIISRLSDVEISDWNRELNAKTRISPQHWRKMAGWVAKSHHFPKFKSRSA